MTALCNRGVLPEPTDVPSPSELARKPRYQAELYTIFGRKQADDYLYPKMERKKPVKVNTKLQQFGGRVGARVLWGTLRKDSHKKLLIKDRKIPDGLKKSYGAFVRELVIQRGGVPVQRSFFAQDDVPELSHLLDKTKSLTIADRHHRFELMARSSQANQDTTVILAYNHGVEEGADPLKDRESYLPSWVEDEEDAESVASYRKWLPVAAATLDAIGDGDQETLHEPVETGKGSDVIDGTPVPEKECLSKGSMEDLRRPLTQRRPRKRTSFPRLRFLTEKDSREAGQFASKFEGDKRASGLNDLSMSSARPGAGMPSRVSHSTALRKDDEGSDRSQSEAGAYHRKARPSTSTSPAWEPLTFNALVEYSRNKPARGEGKFLHGGTKMFPIVSSAVPKANKPTKPV